MRVLRSTLWSPHLEPLSTVVRDGDLIDTLESVRAGHFQPGYFVSSDLFEIDGDDPDIVVCTTAALARMDNDVERNMAIQFYWGTQQFQLVSKDGTVFMPAPCPYPGAKIREVFEQIILHPDYTNQSVRAIGDDGVEVWLKAGEVTSSDD